MISDAYDELIADASIKHGVPFTWIKAVIGAESDFNPNAYRAEPAVGDASYGLMQLLGKTARGLGFTGDFKGLYDPLVNIEYGTRLLKQLRAAWGMDFAHVYSAYNSGGGNNFVTNPVVKAHVDRALGYLAEVEASVTTVEGEQPLEEGFAGIGTLALVAAGAGLIWYFFYR